MIPTESVPSLAVNRAELAGALRWLKKQVKARDQADMVLAYAEGKLTLRTKGAAYDIPAEGRWLGQARLPAAGLAALSDPLPSGDKLELGVSAGSLRVGSLKIACTWQDAAESEIGVPMDAPLWMILGLKHKHSIPSIEAAGLARTVERAEERRDGMVKKAACTLEPLGVDETALAEFVEKSVWEANVRHLRRGGSGT